MSICVVGAGISGLPTAVCIQELAPNCKVTIIAEQITPNTLSDIPAGFWRPFYQPDPRKDLLKKWGEVTFKKMEELWRENPKEYGVDLVSGYELSTDSMYGTAEDDSFWHDTVYGLRRVTEDELRRMGYTDLRSGLFYTSFCLQPEGYLPWVLRKFQNNGGIIILKKLGSLEQIAQDYDVIVNCSGLGSYHLINDKESYPVRGQVYRVKAPFAKMFYIFNDDYYVFPNQDSVVLGGTHQEKDWDTRVRRSDSEKIWSNLTRYLPGLKGAEIIGERVGLRPGRKSIRLERENMLFNGKDVPVILKSVLKTTFQTTTSKERP